MNRQVSLQPCLVCIHCLDLVSPIAHSSSRLTGLISNSNGFYDLGKVYITFKEIKMSNIEHSPYLQEVLNDVEELFEIWIHWFQAFFTGVSTSHQVPRSSGPNPDQLISSQWDDSLLKLLYWKLINMVKLITLKNLPVY